jgi:putative restriction endonuclease
METLSRKDILDRINAMRTWKQQNEQAPHKPLLLLFALSRIANGHDRLISFKDLEEPLRDLLARFGPPRKSYHPEYPFWRLQNDGLWEVPGGSAFTPRQSNSDPPKSELIEKNATGGFPEAIYVALRRDTQLLGDVVAAILDGHFPPSLHEEICRELGI